MPFIGVTAEGETTIPTKVDEDWVGSCPKCHNELRVRESHQRAGAFVCRHFWHPDNSECGGESDEHRRMKAIAWAKAESRWPDAEVTDEESVGDRRADILVKFEDAHERHQKGVAIECQYKHEDKDIEGTSEDFAEAGYSVLWLYPNAFSKTDADFDAGEWKVAWAANVPDSDNWTGYHGVIRWLQSDKPTEVEVEIPPIKITKRAAKQTGIWRSWRNGRRWHDKQEIREKNRRQRVVEQWHRENKPDGSGSDYDRSRSESEGFEIEEDAKYRCQCGVAAYGSTILLHIVAKHSYDDKSSVPAESLLERENVEDSKKTDTSA